MTPEYAETIGLKVLTWLVGNDELLPVFMGSTGSSIDDLKAGAGDAAFLGAILDFLTMDDAWVTQFCDAEGLSYETPMQARLALSGGDVHWT